MSASCRIPPLVGLSGGIGSGKSAVARLFAERGVATLDTDAIYHDLLASDPELAAGIGTLFGADVLDRGGRVDRGTLRRKLADDPAGFAPLEQLAHPLIMAEVHRRASLARTCATFVLVEVPLLFEAGLEGAFAATVYVTAPLETRFDRVHAERDLPRADFDAIVRRQVTPEDAAARADVVLVNDGTPADLEERVRAAFLRLNGLLGRRATR
jgi:dephospho-CoA kinase